MIIQRSKLDKELAAAPDLLARIRLRAQVIHELGVILLNVNDELNTDVDVLAPVVQDLISAYKSIQQLNVDLQAQIASGSDRTLSVEQSAAFASRLTQLQQSMKDALTPAIVTPTPDQPPTPSTGTPISGSTPSGGN